MFAWFWGREERARKARIGLRMTDRVDSNDRSELNKSSAQLNSALLLSTMTPPTRWEHH